MMNKLIILLVSLSFFVSCNTYKEEENFRTFLGKFSVNEGFQIERIQFPIEIIELNEDLTGTVTSSINRDKWEHKYLFYSKSCNEIFPQVFDNFEGELRKSGKRLLAWKGIENGIAEFYYFELKSGKWYLIKVENLST